MLIFLSPKGDYGSPLVARKVGDNGREVSYLIGIASFAVNCTKEKSAVEVYVRVSAYFDWIKSNVERE